MIETKPLQPLELDLAAADRVMTCRSVGLRAYAQAGGLDPARDFCRLDLSGWPLAGQDLAGFDLSGCDLRGTGVESASLGPDTKLDGVLLDEGADPGAATQPPGVSEADLDELGRHAQKLHDKGNSKELAPLAENLLPVLEGLFGAEHPKLRRIQGFVGYGEVWEGRPREGCARLEQVLTCERRDGKAEKDTYVRLWRYHLGCGLLNAGEPAKALEELDALLPLDEAAGGARHIHTLNTRDYRARALLDLGRAAEALVEYDALLPLEEAVRGARDPSTLTTRYDRARALLDLGRAAEALVEYDALLLLDEAVRGARDPSTLATRHYRARALLDLGRAAEALVEYDALLPLDEAVRGARDPSTLTTRDYRARALLDLGRAAEALVEYDALLLLDEAVRGARDPSTLITRYDRARALLDLGRAAEAWVECDDVLPLYEAVRGARDPGTLTIRYLRARALLDQQRETVALAEIRAVVSGYAATKGETHWYTDAARADEIGVRMALGETGLSDELARLADKLARGRFPHAGVVLRARYRLARSYIREGKPEAARGVIDTVRALRATPGVAENRYFQAALRLLATPEAADLPP